METLFLHSFRRCPFAIRVRMVLEEKNIPYQVIEENLSQPSAELLKLHPEGVVPLLIHQRGDQKRVIFQSSIITEYLDETFPGVLLMPKDSIARAQVRMWTYWCDSIFKPDLDLYKYELRSMNEEQNKALKERLHQHFAHWNQTVQKSPYLIGLEMSLADIHLFPFARQFMAVQPSLEGITNYPHLLQWLESMMKRPSFEKVMEKK